MRVIYRLLSIFSNGNMTFRAYDSVKSIQLTRDVREYYFRMTLNNFEAIIITFCLWLMDGIPNVLVDNATIVKVPERKRGRERDIKRDIKFDIPICIRCSICDPLTYFSMLPLIIHFISVLYLPNMHTHTDHSNAMLINFQNVWTILHFYMHTLKLMHHNWLYILTRDCVTSEKTDKKNCI